MPNAITDDPINLIITGVGGQGNVLMSRLIGRAFIKKNYFVTMADDVGVSQRAGAISSLVRISKERQYGPIIPEGRGSLVLGLEPLETLRRLIKYGNPHVFAISNSRLVLTAGALLRLDEYPEYNEIKKVIEEFTQKSWFVDATRIALELGASVLVNVAMLGALIATKLLPLEKQDIKNEMRESLPHKMIELNLNAFDGGVNSVAI